MNIFLLDHDIETSAKYHNDRHVVKMILECAQILCTVCHKYGLKAPYRPTHKNHPCVIWAGQSKANYEYVRKLALCLNKEYKFRFKNRNHKSADVVLGLLTPQFADTELTPFVQAMPDECKNDDPIVGYRDYYRRHKSHIAKWTRRNTPEWWVSNDMVQLEIEGVPNVAR